MASPRPGSGLKLPPLLPEPSGIFSSLDNTARLSATYLAKGVVKGSLGSFVGSMEEGTKDEYAEAEKVQFSQLADAGLVALGRRMVVPSAGDSHSANSSYFTLQTTLCPAELWGQMFGFWPAATGDRRAGLHQ